MKYLTIILATLVPASAAADLADTIVRIESPTTVGSGVMVDPHGIILTAQHVTARGPLTVIIKGQSHPVTRIRRPYGTVENVVAVFVDGTFPDFLAIGTTAPKAGQSVWVAGWPSGQFHSEKTTVTAERLALGPSGQPAEAWATGVRAVVRPGMSGGPLLDSDWNVIGICSASTGGDKQPPGSGGLTVQGEGLDGTGGIYLHQTYLATAATGETATTSKPTLRIFWSLTCVPCQRLVAKWNSSRSFRDHLRERFKVEWVNTDEPASQSLMREYKITTVPTAGISPQLRFAGYTGDAAFKRACDELLDGVDEIAPPPPTERELPPIPDKPGPERAKPPASTGDPERWIPIPEQPADHPIGTPGTQPGQGPVLTPSPDPVGSDGSTLKSGLSWLAANALPIVLGGAGTGGAGLAVAGGVWLARSLLRRRRERGSKSVATAAAPQPLPRRNMAEAVELARLGQLEGRDPLLDATRGMFIDDEIEVADDQLRPILMDFRDRLARRAEQVAPLEYYPHSN